ncbi:PDZ domain-containing protein [Pseudozobellia thermophila]|uniref:PDZ domain-containing protein n=1 Tax=Pseudozobellia thermophila TaxID=192903 RepID=A0A1M6G384_9FLAO|nr:PDZ domain-containing protein [Pseudozobellia thermophila]SHJ04322.1 PDZ domain-containing protein [Pseudozobellia thermophila]
MKRGKIVVFLLGLMTLCLSCGPEEGPIEIFVSHTAATNGDDQAPLQYGSLEEAVAKAAELKKDRPGAEVVITLAPGEYHLEKTIEIPPSLSKLTIRGTDASKVTITGGRPLQLDWQKYNESIYVAEVSETADFDQFLVDGKPQILARYPNYNEEGGYWQGYAADALSKERVASWENPVGAYFHAMHNGRWGGFHFRVTGVDEDGTPILEGGHQNNRASKPHGEFRMVENVFEELDTAGEWFLDPSNNKLYYWPPANVDMGSARFEVSVLKDLVRAVGTLQSPVKNVTLSGITFKNTQRTFMEDFEPLLRSDWTIYRGAAVFFENTENCTVENSVFTHLGGNVIMASKYNKGLIVTGNHIYDCGASGVSFIGDPSAVRSPSFNYSEFVPVAEMDTVAGPKNEAYPRECLVENNLIHKTGRLEKQTAGVQIAMAMDITVRHNSIYDVPRAGINIGDGTWGGHILEYNDVFNTVLETSDHGSFNSWGRDRFWHPNRAVMDSLTDANPNMWKWDAIHTTIIRNNRFRCDHGWDIDLDDGSSNYHIYNNLLLNNGLKLREGFARVAENNIMVNNSLHPHVWFKNSQDVFRHNIVQKAYQDIRLDGWGKELDHNLFPNEVSMMKSRVYDRDLNSVYGDPLFKDPAHLDFSVLENSPAFKIGFKNFPMDKFGVQKPELKALAKTPEVPNLNEKTKEGAETAPVMTWLRNKLKNVSSKEEQSAYGLNTAEGVIVLSVWEQSPAVLNKGLKAGDVIVQANGKKLKGIRDFFNVVMETKTQEKLDLTVVRNQSEIQLSIRTK